MYARTLTPAVPYALLSLDTNSGSYHKPDTRDLFFLFCHLVSPHRVTSCFPKFLHTSRRCLYLLQPFPFLPLFFFFIFSPIFLLYSSPTPACLFLIFPFFPFFPPRPTVFYPRLSRQFASSICSVFLCISAWTGHGQNSLPQVWQREMFLPTSSFFGKEQKGVQRLSYTYEIIRVTPRVRASNYSYIYSPKITFDLLKATMMLMWSPVK